LFETSQTKQWKPIFSDFYPKDKRFIKMKNQFTIEINDDYLYLLYKAKNTLWYFNDLIKNGFLCYKAIKFKNDDDVFVWLENVTLKEGFYYGFLAENNKQYNISMDKAIDWMIVEDSRMIGGYSIRYYVNTLDAEEKLNFEIECGFRIDDGNDSFKPDLSTAEGAIMMLENFYNSNDLNGIFSCKDFYEEAKNILIENDINIHEETVRRIESVLKVSFIEHIESKGFPDFNNVERVFTLIDENEGQQLIEEKVVYRDFSSSINKLWVTRCKDGTWRVLNTID